jgi:hypothetical protein
VRLTATDVAVLHRYAQGVMDRAEHHAGHVKAIALALLGGIVWRADPNSISIRQHAGNLANVLWLRIGGRPYAFSYNHKAGKIEIRNRTVRGSILYAFDDQTPVAIVESAFRSL